MAWRVRNILGSISRFYRIVGGTQCTPFLIRDDAFRAVDPAPSCVLQRGHVSLVALNDGARSFSLRVFRADGSGVSSATLAVIASSLTTFAEDAFRLPDRNDAATADDDSVNFTGLH